MMFENKMMTQIFVPEQGRVTAEWIKLHGGFMICILYSTMLMRWRWMIQAGHLAYIGDMRNLYMFQSGNLKVEATLQTQAQVDDIIKKYFVERTYEDRVTWLKIRSCLQAVVNIVMNLNTLSTVRIVSCSLMTIHSLQAMLIYTFT